MSNKYNRRLIFLAIVTGLCFSVVSNNAESTVKVSHHFETRTIGGIELKSLSEKGKWATALNRLYTSTTSPPIINSSWDDVRIHAPKVTLRDGFRATPAPGKRVVIGVPTFPVNCVNLVDPTVYTQGDSRYDHHGPGGVPDYPDFVDGYTDEEFQAFCQHQIEILNDYFENEDGGKMVRFSLKNSKKWDSDFVENPFYQCVSDPGWTLATACKIGDCSNESANKCFNNHFVTSDGPGDPDAINIVLFDYRQDASQDESSFGSANWGNAPWILLNFIIVDEDLFKTTPCANARNHLMDDDLNQCGHIGRRGIAHEMGHAFGLGHIEEIDSTNVMYADRKWIEEVGGVKPDLLVPNPLYYPPFESSPDQFVGGNRLAGYTGFYYNGLDIPDSMGGPFGDEIHVGDTPPGYNTTIQFYYYENSSAMKYEHEGSYYTPNEFIANGWKTNLASYGQAEIVMSFAEHLSTIIPIIPE